MLIKVIVCLEIVLKIKETPQKMLNIKTKVGNQTEILTKEIHKKIK